MLRATTFGLCDIALPAVQLRGIAEGNATDHLNRTSTAASAAVEAAASAVDAARTSQEEALEKSSLSDAVVRGAAIVSLYSSILPLHVPFLIQVEPKGRAALHSCSAAGTAAYSGATLELVASTGGVKGRRNRTGAWDGECSSWGELGGSRWV